MISKFLSATVVVLASSSLVAAQTHSLCNPVKGDSKLSPPRYLGQFYGWESEKTNTRLLLGRVQA